MIAKVFLDIAASIKHLATERSEVGIHPKDFGDPTVPNVSNLIAKVSALALHSRRQRPVLLKPLDACDDGALNLYDAIGSPLLGTLHAMPPPTSFGPRCLAVGRAGSSPCSTSSKVTAAQKGLEGLRCSGQRTSRDALYWRITR